MHITLGQSGSICSTDMPGAENLSLVQELQTFRTLVGLMLHFICYQLVTRRSSHIMEMIKAETLILLLMVGAIAPSRKV